MAQTGKNDILKEGWIKKRTKRLKQWRELYGRIEDHKYLCLYTDDHTKTKRDKIDIGQSAIQYNVNKPKQFQVYDFSGNEHNFELATIIDSTNWLINLKQINGITPQPILIGKKRGSISIQSDLDLIPTRTPTVISNSSEIQMFELSSDVDEQKVSLNQFDVDEQYMKAIFLYQNQEYEQCEQITRSVLRMDKHHPQALQLYRYLVDRDADKREDSKSIFRRKKKKNKDTKHLNLGDVRRRDSDAEYSRSDADTSNYTLNSSEATSTMYSRSITSMRSRSFAPVIIGRIDGALNLYYNRFPLATYKNSMNHNKFKAFCEEQFDNDDEEIQEEIDGGLDECILVKFDEDSDEINRFPFEYIIDPKKRNQEIFKIIHHCYHYKKPPQPLLQFEMDDFFYVLDTFDCPIWMRPKSSFLKSTKHGLKLNKRRDDDDMITLYLDSSLRELIGISQSNKNNRFNKDFVWLLLESFGRYCIMNEIEPLKRKIRMYDTTFVNDTLRDIYNNMDISADDVEALEEYLVSEEYDTESIIEDIQKGINNDDYDDSNILSVISNESLTKVMRQNVYDEITLCDPQKIYGQIYFSKIIYDNNSKQIGIVKMVSNLKDNLIKEYKKNYLGKYVSVLVIDGSIVYESHRSYIHADSINDNELNKLRVLALDDYDDIVFRFMSCNKFYWSLVRRKDINFFRNAFRDFDRKVCAPLSLHNIIKMDDNIFIFWVYIWSMSTVIKTYMQSGDITIPLQVDLVIIPNSNLNEYIDNISERFNIYDQKFETVLCDPSDIASLQQKMEGLLMKCSMKMRPKEHRIIIIIDRRSRSEYFKDKHCDRIFGYKPPTKYAQIDKKHEILNCIWNTSSFIIPPPPKYEKEELSGAKDNNLFVLSYLIRKKSQFIHLFEEHNDESKELEKEFAQSLNEDNKTESSYVSSLQSASDMSVPQNLTTPGAKDLAAKLRIKNLTNVELKQLWQEALDAMNFNATIREISEYQAVQSYIMKMAMARKRDNVVNTYLFYNGGYCRFEAADLIRIIPHFFHLKSITNYPKMIRDFKMYHDKLWEIDDEIWMKYKDEYLRSHTAMDQRIKIELIGTDPADRDKIAKYCVWNKRNIDDNGDEFESKYDDVEIIRNGKYEKVISINIKLHQFIEWESNLKNGKGIIITKIIHNYYAKYSNINVSDDGELWSVTAINDINCTEMRLDDITNILNNIDESKGYKIKLIGGLFRIIDTSITTRCIATSIKLSEIIKFTNKKKRNHGLQIKEILNTDYGAAFRETGVSKGWYIVGINSVDIINQTAHQFKNYLKTKIYSKGTEYKIRCKYYEKNTNLLPSKARKNSVLYKPK